MYVTVTVDGQQLLTDAAWRHGLMTDGPKALRNARKPYDYELVAVEKELRGAIEEKLTEGGEITSAAAALTLLKVAVSKGLAALPDRMPPTASSQQPAASGAGSSSADQATEAAAAPSSWCVRPGGRAVAAITLRCRLRGWELECSNWMPQIIHSWHPLVRGRRSAPTSLQRGVVVSLLQHELRRAASGDERARASQVLRAALLRVGAVEPVYEPLDAILASPPPLWFLLGERHELPLEAVLDPALLKDESALEQSELEACVARAVLGSTVEEVLATLRADASMPFSDDVRKRVLANGKRVPSRRCGQLVLLAGGAPALRYVDSVIGALSYILAHKSIDLGLLRQCMLVASAAGEYFVMSKDGSISMCMLRRLRTRSTSPPPTP